MRALIIGPDQQEAIRKVVAFASEPQHWYGFNMDWIPGENPDYIVRVPDGFRCVFTLTKKEDRLFRQLTVSVAGPLLPNLEACIVLAKEFGFTASDDELNLAARMQNDGWLVSPGHEGENCVLLIQEITEK